MEEKVDSGNYPDRGGLPSSGFHHVTERWRNMRLLEKESLPPSFLSLLCHHSSLWVSQSSHGCVMLLSSGPAQTGLDFYKQSNKWLYFAILKGTPQTLCRLVRFVDILNSSEEGQNIYTHNNEYLHTEVHAKEWNSQCLQWIHNDGWIHNVF